MSPRAFVVLAVALLAGCASTPPPAKIELHERPLLPEDCAALRGNMEKVARSVHELDAFRAKPLSGDPTKDTLALTEMIKMTPARLEPIETKDADARALMVESNQYFACAQPALETMRLGADGRKPGGVGEGRTQLLACLARGKLVVDSYMGRCEAPELHQWR